ncbi:citrate/2-methylcitrate synthase [Feifania hominis]|uniref:Citrate synthase n=1 Tax=Feifania hominis TaxID=2763660 RepID=A0A926HUS1_9FIRM|nr:citrate/2-methylcitrate synthase [Feifania hominis]MBC8536225.1 citrate/2-methylcitrate synthase [Feifania hominis]
MALKDSKVPPEYLDMLCQEYRENNIILPEHYQNVNVKRGLRNKDGTGVVAGVTLITNVHGYLLNEGDVMPVPGELTYRGINIQDIVDHCLADNRFGYEEVAYLLLVGKLPTAKQLDEFIDILAECRELPKHFTEDVLINSPSPNIMNKLQSSILSLYAFDKRAEELTLANVLRQSIELVARLPIIVTRAYQVKKYYYDKVSMSINYAQRELSTAENFLYALRRDNQFTELESRTLDLALMLHADHGGGNNSTFAARVLTSTGTDTYSAMAAAVGSLKGPLHGGANLKVMEMFHDMKEHVKDVHDDEEIARYLTKILNREAGDGSGLIYGMGHAVYTLSDPRAEILRGGAHDLAVQKGFEDDFTLLNAVERLTPEVFRTVKGSTKPVCANVDLYSGLVYQMLDIPMELFTPIFAIARITGWAANRLEELQTGGRIIRPAYKTVMSNQPYTSLGDRV